MPYKLKGNCVVNAHTGKRVKCHATRAQAEAHLRALYANVEDAQQDGKAMKTRCPNCKVTVKSVMVNDEPCCPKCGTNIMGVKAGARHSMSDQQHLQMAHDHIAACGANCGAEDSGKAVALKAYADKRDWKALKNYAMTEAGDISAAASILQGLAGLCMSEAMQGEPDDCMECCNIMRAVLAFIGGELDELTAAAPDAAPSRADGMAEEATEGEDMEVNGGAGGEIPPSTEYAAMSFNYIKSLHVPIEEQRFKDVLAVKSIGKDDIQGYLALWGDPNKTDAEREFFTRPGIKGGTDFWDTTLTLPRPLTWEHGLDRNWKGSVLVGQIQEFEDDELGRIYRATLDRATKYRALVDKVIANKSIGTSSDSASQYVSRVAMKNGATWLKQWPMWAAALTATPCEPRMLETVHFKSLGVLLPDPKGNADAPLDVVRGIPMELRREAQLFVARNG